MHRVLILFLLLSGSLSLQAAESAPEFRLKGIDGKQHTLSQYLEDGPLLISFWATWCEPCKKEIPRLIELSEAWADSGLTLVLIAVDTPKSQSRVKTLVKSKKWDVPVLLDTSGKVMRRYKGQNPPVTILVSPSGEIAMRHSGYKPGDEKEIEAVLEALFATESTE